MWWQPLKYSLFAILHILAEDMSKGLGVDSVVVEAKVLFCLGAVLGESGPG